MMTEPVRDGDGWMVVQRDWQAEPGRHRMRGGSLARGQSCVHATAASAVRLSTEDQRMTEPVRDGDG
ncbi:hypothetical protein LOC67_07445 [Stieleria sp. JC731]|uniref:hypothetical protein n=1 Tax=Pirellulaceae TaxID=2691357 RepID=UPI001E63B079|nr:hypothetical protein [Stieleria sp. JC731]MCC9600390.1 hypothetical protein [Stieleria sp. JC731]